MASHYHSPAKLVPDELARWNSLSLRSLPLSLFVAGTIFLSAAGISSCRGAKDASGRGSSVSTAMYAAVPPPPPGAPVEQIVIAGHTDSANYPVTSNALQTAYMGNVDGVVTDIQLTTASTTKSGFSFSTYLGGSGFEQVRDVFVDGGGNVYVTGRSASHDLPATTGVFQPKYGGGPQDAFVAKFTASGKLLFLTYLGGSNYDVGYGIFVDSAGFIYVSGRTSSADFPVTKGSFQTRYGGGSSGAPYYGGDFFVTKIKPDGSGIVWSTYVGGSDDDAARGRLVVDSSGAVYVSGGTRSTNFPVTLEAYQTILKGNGSALVKLSADGSRLIYSTFIGGSNPDGRGGVSAAGGLAVNGNGEAFLCGTSSMLAFPVTPGAFQRTFQGQNSAYVLRISADGHKLLASTLLGGSTDSSGAPANHECEGLDLDSAGNPVVLGVTNATNFPVTQGAFQEQLQGGSDAWVAKLTPNLSSLIFSTYVGTPGKEEADSSSVHLDSLGNIWLLLNTDSSAFPVTSDAIQKSYGGGAFDAVAVKLKADGSRILYATYLGGSGRDFGRSLVYRKR